MTDAEKLAAEQQATAQAKAAADSTKAAEEKAAADKKAAEENKPGPTGLDSLTPADLKAFYERSPQMFKEAGIVQEKTKVEEKKPPTEQAGSAAPKLKFGDVEINLPTDVKVNLDAVNAHLAHAKEIGLDAKQVQAQIDFQTKLAREEAKNQPKVPTPAEIDAANVALLKADAAFGAKFEENMDTARRAAVKFGDKEVLTKLATSDPVLVRHFWKLGLADAEDRTLRAPNRNGEEGNADEQDQQSHLKARYPHPSSQAMFKA